MAENLILDCEIEFLDNGEISIKLDDAIAKEKGEDWKGNFKTVAPPNVMSVDADSALIRISLERRDNNE